MKTFISKSLILLSVVFAIAINNSCMDLEYLDCDNATVTIVNNTSAVVYYSIDPNNTYCSASNSLSPNEELVVDYGAIHALVGSPEYLTFYYTFGDPGAAEYEKDIAVESCIEYAYMKDFDNFDCYTATVSITNNTSYFICYSIDPNNTYCAASDYIGIGETLIVEYGEVNTSINPLEYLSFYYIFGGEGEAEYEVQIAMDSCSPAIIIE